MIEEAQYKQEEFQRYLTKIRIGNKSEKQKKQPTKQNKTNNTVAYINGGKENAF